MLLELRLRLLGLVGVEASTNDRHVALLTQSGFSHVAELPQRSGQRIAIAHQTANDALFLAEEAARTLLSQCQSHNLRTISGQPDSGLVAVSLATIHF